MTKSVYSLFFGEAQSHDPRHAGGIGAAVGLGLFGFFGEFFLRHTAYPWALIAALFCGHVLGWLVGVLLYDRFQR